MIIISLGCNVTGWIKINSSTGSNVGDALAAYDIKVVKESRLYLTEPFGYTNQPPFMNSAISVQTSLSPHNLLSVIKRIEANAGRRSSKRWRPRVLDLDIVDYNGLSLSSCKFGRVDFTHGRNDLTLPHPGIAERPFVLQPIMDIAPFWHHPVSGMTAAQMLKKLPRNSPGKILRVLDG